MYIHRNVSSFLLIQKLWSWEHQLTYKIQLSARWCRCWGHFFCCCFSVHWNYRFWSIAGCDTGSLYLLIAWNLYSPSPVDFDWLLWFLLDFIHVQHDKFCTPLWEKEKTTVFDITWKMFNINFIGCKLSALVSFPMLSSLLTVFCTLNWNWYFCLV